MLLNAGGRTSLVVHWLATCPPMQGTQVQSLIWELRPNMLWGREASVPQVLSLYSRACERQLPKPMSPGASVPQDKPPQREAHGLQLERSPHLLQIVKVCV